MAGSDNQPQEPSRDYHHLDRVILDLRAIADECERAKDGSNVLPMAAYPPALNRIATNLRRAVTDLEGHDAEQEEEPEEEAPEPTRARRTRRR